MLKRVAVFIYGVACYGVFLATFLYAVGFIGNLVVPKTMDSPTRTPFLYALGIDLLLLGIFAAQHSVMARPWFKRVSLGCIGTNAVMSCRSCSARWDCFLRADISATGWFTPSPWIS